MMSCLLLVRQLGQCRSSSTLLNPWIPTTRTVFGRAGNCRPLTGNRLLHSQFRPKPQPARALAVSNRICDFRRFCSSVPIPKPADQANPGDSSTYVETEGSPMALPDQIYPKDTPFENLDCEVAFKGLQPQEKRYAHYMSRAAWEGQLITLFQTSPESPLIFVFLDKVLRSAASIGELETFLKSKFGFTDDDLTGFFVYCGAFLANGGNYRGFGDTKFLPDVPVERMEALLAHSFPGEVDFWTKNCLKPMYNYAKFVRNLGFPPQGVTTYWSSNCDESDAAIVAEYLTEKRMDAYNQRVFKTVENGKTCYEIRLASQQIGSESDVDEERKGIRFRITRGDYSNILGNVVKFLELAEKEAANDVQKSMLKEYIKSFTTGSLDAHKDGSRHWVKDKGPAVETYIGFIENYRDPAGARAEFEGFVAVVNRKASEKLGVLVHKAESIIKSSMPWPREFEKDSYLKPDFTALDVVTFGSSGVPAGINIPNYDEIRQNEGFKNVHLQNAIKAMTNVQKIRFVSESDSDLMKKWREQAFEVQVGLHELLGHGTGKLFRETADGLNFDRNIINPLTGKPVESWYASGQSYDSVFGELSSTYEECRAEAIGIYLSLELPIVEIFGIPTAQEQEDVNYVNWLSMILSGLRGLEVYSVDANKWLQAHGQARYVILRMLLETAPDLVSITETIDPEDQKPDLLVTMNRSELQKSGKEAVRNFLMKMQVFKSLADVTAASKMYLAYSEVPPGSDFARWRDIVVARKKPRTIVVQSNTRLNSSTNEVELLTYPNSPQGFVKSWVDRWTDPEATYGSIRDLYDKDATHFPSEKN